MRLAEASASALGIAEPEMQAGEAAHGEADDVRLVDLERIEHGADVVARPVLRIEFDLARHVRGRIAAGIVRDAPIGAAELAELRLPGAHVAGKFVHEDDRRARPGLLIVQLDLIVRRQMRHDGFPYEAARAEMPASMVTTDPLV